MKDLDIYFPLDKFEELIKHIGWDQIDEWFKFWNDKKDMLLLDDFWEHNVNEDWIWGLAFPLLSQAYKFHNNFSEKKIIGISALPGTGKTTLGRWIESMSLKLNFKVAVISIDDFYLPSQEMALAINNNPWNVSRGFPGTHSIDLMKNKLLKWKTDGELIVPVFDKSLRDGLGDRSNWRNETPELLIIEGWFLGVNPLKFNLPHVENVEPQLRPNEISYRLNIQKNLEKYKDIWSLIDQIWHLKPMKFEYMNLWKSNQEKQMLNKKGSALQDVRLDNFLRMLNASIPQRSFDNINPDVQILIDQDRRLRNVSLN